MAIHTVLTPPARRGHEAEAAEKAVFLKDGFNIYAFLFTGLWLLAKRLWLAFAVFVAIWAALVVGGRFIGLNPLAIGAAQALIGLFLGLEGHALIERKLLRKGWALAGVVEGRKVEEIERRFFEQAAAGLASRQGDKPAARPQPPAPMAGHSGSQPAPVVGLFPDPRGR